MLKVAIWDSLHHGNVKGKFKSQQKRFEDCKRISASLKPKENSLCDINLVSPSKIAS